MCFSDFSSFGKANGFNKYFNSIASNLNESLNEQPISDMGFCSFEEYLIPSNINSIFLDECNSDEICRIINDLQTYKTINQVTSL